MDYYKMLTDYLLAYHNNDREIDIQHFEDLGHTIKVRYYMYGYEYNIDITPFDLLTFIYQNNK